MQTLLPGIIAERVPTSRLAMAVLSVAGRTGPPVLFVHGNVSSSLFWQPTMLALPTGFRPLAGDLRGFGDTDPERVACPPGSRRRGVALRGSGEPRPEPVAATRGLRDYADDVPATIDALGLDD